jgi:hypothetical protein
MGTGPDSEGELTELDRRLVTGDVPEALRGVIMERPWTLDRLLALDLPVDEVGVASLGWQLDLPWWRVDGRWFAVSPNEVRRSPEVFAEQWERTMHADLAAPIHTRDTARGTVLLDGVHRLLKADVTGVERLPRRHVPTDQLARILKEPPDLQ